MNTFFRPGPRRPFVPRSQQTQENHRINHRITAREVFVVGPNGEQLGLMNPRDGTMRAEELGLDLVEVSPNTNPPVCKIMDYGKFKYREQKRDAEARKKRADNTLKELRIRYRTDVGDLEVKLKQAREFLSEGDKVKFSMRFKGREAMHVKLGGEKFDQIIERLSDVASIDERSPISGNFIFVTFAPLKGQKK